MAEPIGDYAGLDARLRDALGQAAHEGDSTGVADAIRSRIAAGDPGTSASGPVAPGWGRRLFGLLLGGILLGVVIVGGSATGVGLALTGSPAETPTPTPTVTAQTLPTTSPSPTATPTSTPTPTPSATAEPVRPPVPPPAPADTAAPGVQVTASNPTVYSANGTGTTITAVASDDVGVVRVHLDWSGYASGSAEMTLSNGFWAYDYVQAQNPGTGHIDFVATAFDAAGNAASATVTVAVAQ